MTKPTYIVSGASSGIGLAITKMLLENNNSVIGIARSIESCNITNDNDLQRTPIDFAETKTTIDKIEQLKLSTQKVDGLICCAGLGVFGTLEQISHQQIVEQFNVNLMAHIFLCKAFVPLLKQQKYGKIIFMGSDAALRGSQQGSIYCASKFALRGFSQALRQECSRSNIGVSIINPGMLNTPFYDNLHFRPGSALENSINMETICDTVKLILNSPPQVVFDEINLSPLKHVVTKSTSD